MMQNCLEETEHTNLTSRTLAIEHAFAIPKNPNGLGFRCEQRDRLFSAYSEAISRAIEVQRQSLANLSSGRSGAWQSDRALECAHATRRRARDEYLGHLKEHGCDDAIGCRRLVSPTTCWVVSRKVSLAQR